MSKSHGLSRTPEHLIWKGMRKRCLNPNCERFPRYGGRGITICERWNNFENFLADMGKRPSPEHSLDRKDNNGNYEPNNCRWADPETQHTNTSQNVFLSLNGITKTLGQWARHAGLKIPTLHVRIHTLGWTLEKALSTPVRRKAA